MIRNAITAAAVAATLAAPAAAAEEVRLGFLTVLSGQLGFAGDEQKKGFDLAMEHLGGKLGGLPTRVFVGDTKGDPGEAVQAANKLIDLDDVQIVTGLGYSHTMMAAAPVLLNRGIFVVGANAGPSPLAGERCHENLFVTSFHNDQWDAAGGTYMAKQGHRNVYFMGMDYQAGWDHTKAAIRTLQEGGGKVAAEVYTPLRQLEFSAELTQLRAAQPDAVYVFYVGPLAIAFLKQYDQAGLKGKIPLYSIGAISDPTLYKAQGDSALGIVTFETWNQELENPTNRKFVEAFRAKYQRDPTGFVQRQYDAIMFLDQAIRDAGGKVEDKDALRAAMRKATFKSARGKFRFNNNHYPIQDIYVQEVAKNEKGELYQKLLGVAVADIRDPDYQKCKMSW